MTLRCEKKILTLEELEKRLVNRGPKKLAHCHGCFDLLHVGHVHYFEFARNLGDLLLVSFNSDDFFVDKGPGRPVYNETLRAIAIAAMEVVDYVCIYPGFIPEKIFETIRPDVYVKGSEYDYRRGNPKIPEEGLVSRYGGIVRYGPDDVVFSSTKIIQSLQSPSPQTKMKKKTVCFDIDGTICNQTPGEYEKAQPFSAAREVINRLYDEGFEIVFFTGRLMGRHEGDIAKVYDQGYDMTLNQLKSWGFKFHKLYLGKPTHHILVDDKALFFKSNWNEIYRAIKEKEHEDIY